MRSGGYRGRKRLVRAMGKTAGWSSQWQSQYFRAFAAIAGPSRVASLLSNRAVRDAPLGSAQPGELRIQHRNRRGRGLLRRSEGGRDVGPDERVSAQALAPVPCLGFSAARAYAAKWFGRLVKQLIERWINGTTGLDHSSRRR